jgi:hypothetical protein
VFALILEFDARTDYVVGDGSRHQHLSSRREVTRPLRDGDRQSRDVFATNFDREIDPIR